MILTIHTNWMAVRDIQTGYVLVKMVENQRDLSRHLYFHNAYLLPSKMKFVSVKNVYRSCVIQRSKIQYRFQHRLTSIHH